MKELLSNYHSPKNKTLEEIIDFHYKFEIMHSFQDKNGREGRLIIFKKCLANNIVPFIIDEQLKHFHYRGLQEWNNVKEYPMNTYHYKSILNYFEIEYKQTTS